ncbi:uncharacterized protein PV09_00201 [Verruconis gallopava]|uniref:Signal peptidase complex subunit 1 n=1 Tax=Verruconis gallopava TaxID=253628 RepID=A0A0D2ARW7_9PEZI|nr:uncharacterized protein PV09_00201 [Verruconis gallopava]KIW09280.1 hypothetical protein PV09_00201 [Verruconis gallopava]
MAEHVLDSIRDFFEGQIDFEGQKSSELLYTALLTAVGLFSFVVGFITQNIYYSVYVGLGGTAVTFLLAVPHWPFYNQNPARFLPSRKYKGTVNVAVDVDGKKVQ